jgi:hypothetical protein
MSTSFIILRRETIDGYSTRGPIVHAMSLKEARAEVVRLKKLYPYQDFVIMGEVGEVSMSERVTVKIDAPDLSEVKPKKRRRRKLPADSESTNVVPMRKEEGC